MTEEVKPTKDEIIEARTAYSIRKEEINEILEKWKKHTGNLDKEIKSIAEGYVITGMMVELLIHSADTVVKYRDSIERYIELMEKRLKEVDVLFQ